MLQVDILVIGQGISGTFLSYYLQCSGYSFVVINDGWQHAASLAAGGLVNPVTGRRVVKTWKADELLPFTWNAYKQISQVIQQELIEPKSMLAFPTAPDMVQAYQKRLDESQHFIKKFEGDAHALRSLFAVPFNIFSIAPCYLIQVTKLLLEWKHYLHPNLFIENFDEQALEVFEDHVQYRNISAKKIIYCNGVQAGNSRFWRNLPFVQNKGQALVVEIPGLDSRHLYKFASLTLSHLEGDNWYAGSSHELNFETAAPTADYFQQTKNALSFFIKIPYKIIDQLSALRPATVERRPFVGFHPQHSVVGILNGMGTKGCSLAPWFAHEFVQNLKHNKPIDKEADVIRFAKTLMRK